MHKTGLFLGIFALSLCSLVVGCEEPEPISRYSVPKHESIQRSLDSPLPESSEPTDRMLAAIVLVEGPSDEPEGTDAESPRKVAWFFKGTGPLASFPEDAAEQFDQLLGTLRFTDPAKPSWDLGENWSEEPGQGMRVANLKLGEVEFSVIKLEVPGANERQYIVDNINRWRRQLQLPPTDSAQLASSSHKIPTADDHAATVVDLLGRSDSGAMPPMAGRSRPSSPPPAAKTTRRFEDRAPTNWQPQRPGMMQEATYLVEDGDKSAKVSVSIAGGGLLANVNRWRGQIGLEPLASQEDIKTESIPVSGVDATLIRILGDEQSIIVALVPQSGSTWFFKLMGDASVVEQEAEAFVGYLSTVNINS